MGVLDPSIAYKPFYYPWAMEKAEEHEKIHWGTWEVKLQQDLEQIKTGTVTAEEMQHITQILRLFTQSDVVVGGNYCEIFLPLFKNNEIRNMLLSFANREGTHQRAYALLNDTLGMPDSEYSAFLEYEAMAEKVEFMASYDVSSKEGIGLALAQSVCNEGMSLFSAFAMLLNFQRHGKMLGMCEVVEWSVRDETTHVEGMSQLFRSFCAENGEIITDSFKSKVYDMYRKAVTLEDAVIDLAFELGDIQDLSAAGVKEYIRFIADRRLVMLGLKPNWNIAENPLDWIDALISGDSVKNFFEGRVTDYSHDSMTGEWGWESL